MHTLHFVSVSKKNQRNRGMGMARLVGAGVLLAGLAGCQAGRTYELVEARSSAEYSAASLRPARSTIELDPEYRAYFERELRRELGKRSALAVSEAASDGGASAGGDEALTIEYRFVGYDPGDGATRVGAAVVGLIGVPTGALGMGTLAVDVSYLDPSGSELARIVTDGPIDGPLGSTKGGLETAAQSIARYTIERFASERARRDTERGGAAETTSFYE